VAAGAGWYCGGVRHGPPPKRDYGLAGLLVLDEWDGALVGRVLAHLSREPALWAEFMELCSRDDDAACARFLERVRSELP
jgi:hypothetical protein